MVLVYLPRGTKQKTEKPTLCSELMGFREKVPKSLSLASQAFSEREGTARYNGGVQGTLESGHRAPLRKAASSVILIMTE